MITTIFVNPIRDNYLNRLACQIVYRVGVISIDFNREKILFKLDITANDY